MNKGRRVILQTAAVIALSTAVAFMFNALRTERLPLVMPFPPEYQCPSRISEGLAMGVQEALVRHGRGEGLFVDARSKAFFDQGHIEGAINVPYSFLDPVPEDAFARLREPGSIIVYCNTEHGERSRLMAGELTDGGLKEVFYLEGGFLGWVEAGGAYTGQKPEKRE